MVEKAGGRELRCFWVERAVIHGAGEERSMRRESVRMGEIRC